MLKIVKASDPISVDRINLCIYAAPGLGKTSLGFTAAAPLLLDFDGGVHRAANRNDSVQVSSWKDVTDMTATDFADYKTVVIDTAGRCLDFLSADLIQNNPKLGRGGALTLQGFGELKSKFSAWLKMLNTFGKDVVLLAHMDEQRSGDEIVERLDVQGGSKGEIYKSVDAMGRIMVDAKGQRILDFSPRVNSFGKNPCNLSVLPFPDPHTLTDTLATIIRTVKERLNEVSAEQKAAQGLIEEWAELLTDFITADDFNRCMDDLRKAPVSVKMLAMKRAKALGLVFNRETSFYEAPHATAS
jgi:AAA domain